MTLRGFSKPVGPFQLPAEGFCEQAPPEGCQITSRKSLSGNGFKGALGKV